MTPQELHQAHLMSLILQRDEIVQRLMELNDQIKEFKASSDYIKAKPVVQ